MTTRYWPTFLKDRRAPVSDVPSPAANDQAPAGTAPQAVPRALRLIGTQPSHAAGRPKWTALTEPEEAPATSISGLLSGADGQDCGDPPSGSVSAGWLSERSRDRGRGWWHRLLIVMFARPRRNW